MQVLPSARSPEVSIVLNLHNETRFLRRTMMSIGQAVSFAAPYGINCEVVCVLDRPDPSTKAWIEAFDFSQFADHATVEVNNGSLGLSRNEGIARARGEYIWLCDADDLISYNILAGLFQTSVAAGPKTIVIPEFLCAFGADFHLARYFGTDKASKLLLFHMHPFISRIFAHRSLFDDLKFGDARLSCGFAYEDWHFNCEALARGYEFRFYSRDKSRRIPMVFHYDAYSSHTTNHITHRLASPLLPRQQMTSLPTQCRHAR